MPDNPGVITVTLEDQGIRRPPPLKGSSAAKFHGRRQQNKKLVENAQSSRSPHRAPQWMREDSPYRWLGQRTAKRKRRTGSYEYRHLTKRRFNVKEMLDQNKIRRGCCVCGVRFPEVLHFHHRDPRTKTMNLSNPTSTDWQIIKAEIRKCDVVCANCHAMIHSGRLARKVKTVDDDSSAGSTGRGSSQTGEQVQILVQPETGDLKSRPENG